MNIVVREIRSSAELDDVLRLRHRVIVDEEGTLPAQPGGRITDAFDAAPGTVHVAAFIDGEMVAAVRLSAAGAQSTPAEKLFDFGPYLPHGARVGCGSMLVALRSARHGVAGGTAFLRMIAMALRWAQERGLTHLIASANPERMGVFGRIGFRPVAAQFLHAKVGLPVLPLVLELSRINFEQVPQDFADGGGLRTARAQCLPLSPA